VEHSDQVVLITGSGGRIGTGLVEQMSSRYRVVGFDHRASSCPASVTDCYEVDFAREESVQRALDAVRSRHGSEIASVIHLAAYYDFSGTGDPRYDEVNVRGTQRLLRGLQSFRVGQFLFSSTILVHRPCEPGQRIDETWPLDRGTQWGYPQSKIQAEDLLLAEHGEIPVVLARIAATYDEMCRLIPLSRHMQRIYERQFTGRLFPGDPSRGATYLHFDDLLEALVRIVDRRAELPAELPLLLGEEDVVSYGELQRELGRLLHGEACGTHVIPQGLAKVGAWVQERLPGDDTFIKPWMIERADDHYALDTTRARRLLEWEPRHTLREMLPAMAAALQRDPARWYEENHLQAPAEVKRSAA